MSIAKEPVQISLNMFKTCFTVTLLTLLPLTEISGQLVVLQGTHTNTDAPATPYMNRFYRSDTGKDKVSESLSLKMFDASEIGNYYISGPDSVEGRQQVRAVSESMRRVQAATGREYFGFFSFPALPGFSGADIAAQPENYRSQSLDSLGRLWKREPPEARTEASRIGFTGEYLDITNGTAVNELLSRISVTFNYSGGEESVGALYGYYMFSEDKLTGGQQVGGMGVFDNDGNPSVTQNMRLGNGERHDHLYGDDDPYYSLTSSPKRLVPLYSESAGLSFAAYAATQGYPEITKLPFDRNEFNHCGGGEWCVRDNFPPHVVEAPYNRHSPSVHWKLWRAWCLKVWSEFVEKIAMVVSMAQAENPDFKGCIYFQPPTAYALPESYEKPISYWYYSESGIRQDVMNFDMKTYEFFDALNSVTSGTDMDYLMGSPWFAGMVHETASSLIRSSQTAGMALEEKEVYLLNSALYQHFFIAHGATAKKRCEDEGKIFGAFFRTGYLSSDAIMDVPLFEEGFNRVIDPLGPAILFTIGDGALIEGVTAEHPSHFPDPPFHGSLETAFQSRLIDYRANAPFVITDIPWHRTVTEGSDVQFTTRVAGGLSEPDYTYRYRWQKSIDGGVTWENAPSTDATLTIPTVSLSEDGAWFRCRARVIQDGTPATVEELFTASARLTVKAGPIFSDGFETGNTSRWSESVIDG